jgi:phage gp29-like protein
MKHELKNEIATTRDGRDITRGYVDGLPLLPSTDRLLALKGNGDVLIYQEVLRDEQVKACFEQRVRAVVSKPWEVKPGGDKRIDKQAATFIEEQLKKINFDSVTEKMLYGVFYGYAVAEALYAADGSFIVLDAIKVRDRRRFGFAPDMSLRLRTSTNPMGEALPDKKFWTFATGSDHDDEPYGLGLAHWLYWPVFFKRSGIKFWLVFLEKFGSPTAVGKYPSGTNDTDQNKLLNALQAIQTDSAITIPEGMIVELLEAKRGGTADYTALYDRMDAAIARATLGQTASTQGTPGKLGNDDLQGDVRDDIVKADADLVCMSFNATVVKWLVEWNFPGAALPQVWRKCEDDEDANQQAERDERISKMGFKPTLKYIQDKYGGEWVVVNAPVVADIAGLPSPQSAQFAEPLPSDGMDALANTLGINTATHWDALIASVKKRVDAATDLTVLQQDLVASFGDLPTDELVRVMAAGLALAELKGMADVADGN